MKYVAEIGGNHHGSLSQAFDLIASAKKAGATAVKLQTWTADTMAIPGYVINGGLWDGRELADLYREIYTPWFWYPALFAYAKTMEIELFSAPFDVGAVEFLEIQDCPYYKIASFELIDTRLLRAVGATRKPVIVSTGMANREEIYRAVETLTQAGAGKITLLHCVSNYPTDASDADLLRLRMLMEITPHVGLSDHSVGNLAAVAATILGAEVIEKHFTLHRTGPDAAFSVFPHEFRGLVNDCEQVRRMMKLPALKSQEKSRQLRRSLYFAHDLEKDHVLTLADIKSCRPALGLSADQIDDIIGQKLTMAVTQNEPITLTKVTPKKIALERV